MDEEAPSFAPNSEQTMEMLQVFQLSGLAPSPSNTKQDSSLPFSPAIYNPKDELIKTQYFTQFPRLPGELRDKIWMHASFHPRNIDIGTAPLDTYLVTSSTRAKKLPFCYISKAPPPALLHTCRESRNQGLKHYDLQFENEYTYEGSGFRRPQWTFYIEPRIYINWAVDRLVILRGSDLGSSRSHAFLSFLEYCERKKLQRLAVNIGHDARREGDDFVVSWPPVPASVRELFLFNQKPEHVVDEVLRKGRTIQSFEDVNDETERFGSACWRRLKEMEVWRRKFKVSLVEKKKKDAEAIGATDIQPLVRTVKILFSSDIMLGNT